MMDINGIKLDKLEDISTKSTEELKRLNEYKNVMLFKDVFDQNKFPNDFDTWGVKEQCSWINQNITEFFPNVPQSLLTFIPAAFCQLNCYDRSPQELPKWMDMDKYRRGQKFVNKHYTAVIISKILGLMYVYSFTEGMRPAIIGEHSHTPYLGFQKYLPTIKRILSWYNGEPWVKGTEAYEDIQVARRKHLAITAKMCQMDHEQIAAACTYANPWCPDRKLLLKDFEAACPHEKVGQRPYTIISKSPYKPKGINNADVAAVQGSFVVLFLLYPQNIGIHDATDEDLEAFCHMWRCYGYFLGLQDEYNFCRGSLEDIRQRVHDLYQYWTIPNFKDMTPEWEHTTRCLVEPLNYYPFMYMPYKVMTLIATDALNLKMSNLYASLSYTEWITYEGYKFILRHVLKFSGIRAVVNKFVRKIVNEALKFDAKKLEELHEKSKKELPDFSISGL